MLNFSLLPGKKAYFTFKRALMKVGLAMYILQPAPSSENEVNLGTKTKILVSLSRQVEGGRDMLSIHIYKKTAMKLVFFFHAPPSQRRSFADFSSTSVT